MSGGRGRSHAPAGQGEGPTQGRRANAWAVLTRLLGARPPRAGTEAALGRAGERAARSYLAQRGYRVLARNVRTARGEADIVCRGPNGTIVVVEVKSRVLRQGAAAEARPEDALTHHKRTKLLEVTQDLVRLNRWQDRPVRVDLVAIDFAHAGRGARPVAIRHHEAVVRTGLLR